MSQQWERVRKREKPNRHARYQWKPGQEEHVHEKFLNANSVMRLKRALAFTGKSSSATGLTF